MQISIQKWGNSAAIRLSQGLLQQINARIGDTLEVEIKDGGVFVKPISDPEITLEELLEGSPKEILILQEDQEWVNERPKGKEIW